MALKGNWNDKADDVDFVLAKDINDIAHAVIESENEIEGIKKNPQDIIDETKFSNALKGSARGNSLILDDVSPIEHTMKVSAMYPIGDVTCADLANNGTSLKCHLSSSEDIVLYIENSQNWVGNMLRLYKNSEGYPDQYEVYVLRSGNEYTICEDAPWGNTSATFGDWVSGSIDFGSFHHAAGDHPSISDEGLYLILGVNADISNVVVTVSPDIDILDVNIDSNAEYFNLKCKFSTVEELESCLDSLDWSRGIELDLVRFEISETEYVSYFIRNTNGDYKLCEKNNTWGDREFSLEEWVSGSMNENFYGYLTTSVGAYFTQLGGILILDDPNAESKEYLISADGTAEGVKSIYPSTKITTNDSSIIIFCEYNRDIGKALERLTRAIISLGGIV